jgi:hypothetical protein
VEFHFGLRKFRLRDGGFEAVPGCAGRNKQYQYKSYKPVKVFFHQTKNITLVASFFKHC